LLTQTFAAATVFNGGNVPVMNDIKTRCLKQPVKAIFKPFYRKQTGKIWLNLIVEIRLGYFLN